MLAILIVNFNTLQATLDCLEALLADVETPTHVYLLDNGSGGADAAALTGFADRHADMVEVFVSKENLGFADGNNFLITRALANPATKNVLLLNSDTLPTAGFSSAMMAGLDPSTNTDMVAAQLLNPKTGAVDSLGISLYKSTLASNRKSEEDILLGPSGGCALFSRRLLQDLQASHGEFFDSEFFCYAEDTDLVIRARWLGYRSAYAADAKVFHAGSLSSGGPENDFVLYHGIRNSLWWLAKDAPMRWLLPSLPLFLVLHAGICIRHLRRGRMRVLWRLYRDALRGLPRMLKKRETIKQSRRIDSRSFKQWVVPRFYERNYVSRAWRELWLGAKQK